MMILNLKFKFYMKMLKEFNQQYKNKLIKQIQN